MASIKVPSALGPVGFPAASLTHTTVLIIIKGAFTDIIKQYHPGRANDTAAISSLVCPILAHTALGYIIIHLIHVAVFALALGLHCWFLTFALEAFLVKN